jgi:hypothetical protein
LQFEQDRIARFLRRLPGLAAPFVSLSLCSSSSWLLWLCEICGIAIVLSRELVVEEDGGQPFPFPFPLLWPAMRDWENELEQKQEAKG